MGLIIENGYYLSDVYHYVDFHAGHKFEKLNYTAFLFLENMKVMKHGKSNNKIFNQNEFITQGQYEVENDVVTITFGKGEQFESKFKMVLIQKGQLMNDSGTIFEFTKWTE